MNRILCSDLEQHFDDVVYKYQVFQIQPVLIDRVKGVATDCENPLIHLKDIDRNSIKEINCNFCTFYPTMEDARKRQALDIHKLLNHAYIAEDNRDKSAAEYFKRFIDERDLEFFITSVTGHQLTESEYWDLLNSISEDYPEKLI